MKTWNEIIGFVEHLFFGQHLRPLSPEVVLQLMAIRSRLFLYTRCEKLFAPGNCMAAFKKEHFHQLRKIAMECGAKPYSTRASA
jgi:hypothetical protein